MKNDYSEEEDLKRIINWDERDPRGWFDFIKSIWWMPEWGWTENTRRIYISTAGWSGNENIIEAMQGAWILWTIHWYSTRAGGHYIFKLPKRRAR